MNGGGIATSSSKGGTLSPSGGRKNGRGSATDPQSLNAMRRERINERFKDSAGLGSQWDQSRWDWSSLGFIIPSFGTVRRGPLSLMMDEEPKYGEQEGSRHELGSMMERMT
ncbi:hypothetical protein COCNU_13G006800 [Cocos nucifera]|uniref:Uncharacterized protein n=1 Tax=Cocos nucifera TaxID=13894 RepID=A0A8K0ITK2_COCNU|nr:hypothetical protein COCNU_13G006800 [Cocos nucifera]